MRADQPRRESNRAGGPEDRVGPTRLLVDLRRVHRLHLLGLVEKSEDVLRVLAVHGVQGWLVSDSTSVATTFEWPVLR